MDAVRAIHRITADIQVAQNPESHEGSQALTVGWNFAQLNAVVFLRERRDPLGCVLRQVLERQGSPFGGCLGGDAFGELAPVKCFAVGCGNFPQSFGLLRACKGFADGGWSAAGEKCLVEFRVTLEAYRCFGPYGRHRGRYEEPLFGIADGRFEKPFERQFAESLRQL